MNPPKFPRLMNSPLPPADTKSLSVCRVPPQGSQGRRIRRRAGHQKTRAAPAKAPWRSKPPQPEPTRSSRRHRIPISIITNMAPAHFRLPDTLQKIIRHPRRNQRRNRQPSQHLRPISVGRVTNPCRNIRFHLNLCFALHLNFSPCSPCFNSFSFCYQTN